MEYAERLQALLAHRIGLWDVVAKARRQGSLDSNIRDHAGKDLAGLIGSMPELAEIAFNSKTAARIGMTAHGTAGDRHAILHLPSSSPAYTVSYAQKREAWLGLRPWLALS
jgi:hypoxanthine-DNA glycosylase